MISNENELINLIIKARGQSLILDFVKRIVSMSFELFDSGLTESEAESAMEACTKMAFKICNEEEDF